MRHSQGFHRKRDPAYPIYGQAGHDVRRQYHRPVAIEVIVEVEERVVVLRLTQTVTRGDFVAARSMVTSARGWQPSFAHVLDFTGVEKLELSHADVQTLATAKPIFDLSAPQILVARPRSVNFGLARMFQIYAEGRRDVHVVDSMEDARKLIALRA